MLESKIRPTSSPARFTTGLPLLPPTPSAVQAKFNGVAGSSFDWRRLAYVGMTRARKKLWMTHAQIRRVWGQEQMNPPSRFIKEIPKELIEQTSAVGSRSGSFVHRFGSDSEFGRTSAYGNKSNSYSQNNHDDDSQNFPDYDDSSQAGSSGFSKGQRVRHPTFGVGSIFETEGAGDTLKISILFQDNTIKKFVAKYARLERV